MASPDKRRPPEPSLSTTETEANQVARFAARGASGKASTCRNKKESHRPDSSFTAFPWRFPTFLFSSVRPSLSSLSHALVRFIISLCFPPYILHRHHYLISRRPIVDIKLRGRIDDYIINCITSLKKWFYSVETQCNATWTAHRGISRNRTRRNSRLSTCCRRACFHPFQNTSWSLRKRNKLELCRVTHFLWLERFSFLFLYLT